MGKVDWGYLEPSKRSCNNCEFNFDDVCAGHGDRIDNGEDTTAPLSSNIAVLAAAVPQAFIRDPAFFSSWIVRLA